MISRTYVGIDPGSSGALAVLDHQGDLIAYCDMPTLKTGKRTRVNGAALAQFLASLTDQPLTAYLESAGARPGQGTASMFSFGHSAGVVEGVIAALGIPLSVVTPQTWKRHYGLAGKSKELSRTRAVQLYPRAPLGRKKDHALAEAILIARYGLESGG